LPPKGGADRKAFERVLRKHNLADRARPALVCGLVDVAKRYAALGLGIAVLYVTDEAARSTPGLHVRRLDSESERLSIEMAVRKGTHLPDYVEAFRRLVRQYFARHR
jgi:DNA-binding transcriptional LysR family regulator